MDTELYTLLIGQYVSMLVRRYVTNICITAPAQPSATVLPCIRPYFFKAKWLNGYNCRHSHNSMRLLISFSNSDFWDFFLLLFPNFLHYLLPHCPLAHTCSSSWNSFFDVSFSLKDNGRKIYFHKKMATFPTNCFNLNFFTDNSLWIVETRTLK